METYDLNLEKHSQSWMHYHIYIKDRNMYFYENNSFVSSVNMVPTTLQAVANEATYWKIHNYEFNFNNSVSPKWTRIHLNGSCYVLHASTCSDCSINLSTSTGANYSLSSNNDQTMWTWISQTLSFGNSTDNYMDILRKTHNNDMHGFWGIDIRQCSKTTKNGKVIHERFLEERLAEETFCSTLDHEDTNKDNFKHRDCNVGELGSKCNITCEELFSNDSICEMKKICYDQRCTCTWGYSGKYCQDTCDNGKWGVDCENNCINCSICNSVTGKCQFNENLENLSVFAERQIGELTIYSKNNSIDSNKNSEMSWHGKESSRKTWNLKLIAIIVSICIILLVVVGFGKIIHLIWKSKYQALSTEGIEKC